MNGDDASAPGLRPFQGSPDEGEPDCLCSYCGNRIEDDEEDDQDGFAIRMWPPGGRYEIRLHPRCLNAALELGLLKLPPSKS